MLTHSANHTHDQITHINKLNVVQRPTGHHWNITLHPAHYWKHTQADVSTHTGMHTHHPTCVTSHNAAKPIIFPRGPLHVIGHAQSIPSVDPEPDALLISGMAICVCVFERVSVMMRWQATGGTARLAAWQQRASRRGKVKWRTTA